MERYRAGQLRAEHLLKAREQSHRQQVQHLKNEVNKYLFNKSNRLLNF